MKEFKTTKHGHEKIPNFIRLIFFNVISATCMKQLREYQFQIPDQRFAMFWRLRNSIESSSQVNYEVLNSKKST